MQRVTITIEDELLAAVDTLMRQRGYGSRSEAVRDIIRERLSQERLEAPGGRCLGVLTYVFDHQTRDLPGRLTRAHHDRHDLSIASLHVHLNHERCLEVSVMHGTQPEVRGFADAVASQRGVRHANLHLIPAQISAARHAHGAGSAAHEHVDV